ncbi:MAG: MATE family efflux transporter [Candidatus Neomarinimicrobiota bacterium]
MQKSAGTEQSRVAGFLANPRKALWQLSLPILGGMAIHTLYSVADMIFVGWVGAEAVAALAFNMPLIFFAYGTTMGLSSGATAVVAQALGGKDKTRADNTAEHAVFLGIGLGAGLTVMGLLWGSPLLAVLGAKGEIHALAWRYFQVIAMGISFSVLSAFFRGIMAGEGDTIRPMTLMGGGMVLNLVLDPIFIFGLNLGVRGAAIATVVSQFLVFLIFIYLIFLRRTTFVEFRLRHFRYRPAILSGIFRIGLPASLSFVIMALGAAVFNRILSGYSHHAVAAYQIGGRIEMIYLMPIIAISTGAVTLVGMFYGAKEYGHLRAIIRYAIERAILFGLLAAAVIYPLAPQIMMIFKPSPEILEIGVSYLRINALAFPIAPLGMISARVLQGMGRGLPFLVITFLRVLALSAPIAILFTYVLHLPVTYVWFAMVISIAIASTTGVVWLLTVLRQTEQLPQAEPAVPAPEPAVEGAG